MRRSFAFAVGILLVLGAMSTEFAAQAPPLRGGPHTVPSAEERVDLNTASLDQLTKIPGMTRTWAARIIRFRPYRAKNDLHDRGVLSDEVYNHIKDYVIAHRAKQ